MKSFQVAEESSHFHILVKLLGVALGHALDRLDLLHLRHGGDADDGQDRYPGHGGLQRPQVSAYLIFVIFLTRAKFLENKIYTEKTRKLRQNTHKIANFLRYYGKIHSKLPIFRVKSVKIYTGRKKITQEFSWLS